MLQNHLVDTNVILDLVLDREGVEDAIRCFDVFDRKSNFEGWIAAHTPSIVHYVGRKKVGNEAVLQILELLSDQLEIAPFSTPLMRKALGYGIPDFEDAMQVACAENIGAIAIITRDKKDFRNAVVPFLTPQEFLARHGGVD